MDKTKTQQEPKEKRTQFCSCKNSCQRKTGPKKAGCPCKDKGVYCSERCNCGTNLITCRNKQQDDKLGRSCTEESDLVSGLSNLQVIDDIDGERSNEETPHRSSRIKADNIKQDVQSPSAKGKGKGKQRLFSQSTAKRADKINNGYALVIHNRYFQRLRPREGSEKDLDAIKLFCKEAGLTVDIQENLKVNEIREHCRKLTEDESIFDSHDGLVCFILSHGNSSGICGIYDETISVREIVTYFKECEDLLGKPKLFFIQACRRGGGLVEDDGNEGERRKMLCPPDSSDILIAQSTIEGELSFRDIRNGSWFVQTLMKQLKTHAQSMHLMDIMTVVNEDIAGSELEGYRQMPIQVSTLTKFVYFKMANAAKVLAERKCLS